MVMARAWTAAVKAVHIPQPARASPRASVLALLVSRDDDRLVSHEVSEQTADATSSRHSPLLELKAIWSVFAAITELLDVL